MVDHQPRIGVSRRQLCSLLQAPPAHQVDRQGMLRRGGQNPVDAGVGGVGRDLVSQHDPDADRAVGGSPVGDRIGDGGIGGIDRLDQPEPGGMRGVNREGVAGVVAIHRKRRHQHGAVDTDGVHRGHHLVAGDLRRALQNAGPGAARMVAFVGVNLGIQCRHDVLPSSESARQVGVYRYFAGRIIARHICATGLLSKPRPCSGWRKLRPIMSVNSSSSTCTLGSNE